MFEQVLDPVEQETERKAVTVWAETEARTFVEKFLMYPKNFEKIAACLDGKTTRDCVVRLFFAYLSVAEGSEFSVHECRQAN